VAIKQRPLRKASEFDL